MAGTNIDLDDAACAVVMRRFRLASKREAVNMALRELATRPLSPKSSVWNGRHRSSEALPTQPLEEAVPSTRC